MKFLITALSLVFTALPAWAQTASSDSTSSSLSGSQSGASAGSASVIYLDQSSPGTLTTRQEGKNTTRLEAAPSLGSLALGGGHPCAFSPVTAQISIIGGGAGAGGMRVDGNCMLMLMSAQGIPGSRQALIYGLAAKDRSTCVAMYKAKMVTDCKNSKGKSYVKTASTAPVKSSSKTMCSCAAGKTGSTNVVSTIKTTPMIGGATSSQAGISKTLAAPNKHMPNKDQTVREEERNIDVGYSAGAGSKRVVGIKNWR